MTSHQINLVQSSSAKVAREVKPAYRGEIREPGRKPMAAA